MDNLARPLQAAVVSAFTFSAGAAIPLLVGACRGLAAWRELHRCLCAAGMLAVWHAAVSCTHHLLVCLPPSIRLQGAAFIPDWQVGRAVGWGMQARCHCSNVKVAAAHLARMRW